MFLDFFLFSKNSIRKRFVSCFKKEFLSKELKLLIYESEIIIISIFLFISSSFFFNKNKQKYFDFNWKQNLKIFSKTNLKEFIDCAIRHLLDMNFITRNKAEIAKFFKDRDINFQDKYMFSLIKKNSKKYIVKKEINFPKYLNLINKSVVIHNFYKYAIPRDVSAVNNFIQVTWDWKKEVFEMFGNKAEYIVFMFFRNLSK